MTLNTQEIRRECERRQDSKPVGSSGYNDAGIMLELLAEVDRLTAELDTVAAANARLAAERDALAGQLAEATAERDEQWATAQLGL